MNIVSARQYVKFSASLFFGKTIDFGFLTRHETEQEKAIRSIPGNLFDGAMCDVGIHSVSTEY